MVAFIEKYFPLPFFGIGYFIFVLVSKMIQLKNYFLSYPEKEYFIYYFFNFLFEEFFLTVSIYIILDGLASFIMKISKNWLQTSFLILLQFVFLCIISYISLNLKIFQLFNTVLSIDLLSQVDQLFSQISSITAEVDFYSVFLILFTSIYCVLFVYFYFLFFKKIKNIEEGASNLKNHTLIIFLLFVFSSWFSRIFAVNQDQIFYSFQKSGLGELIASAHHSLNKKEIITRERMAIDLSSDLFKNKIPDQILNLHSKNPKYNIIVYKMESTTSDYVGYVNAKYKHITPNMNELVKNSIVLNNHYTTEPASQKALHSVLTGRMPIRTSDWNELIDASKDYPNLPKLLSSNGYVTRYISTGNGKIYNEAKYVSRWFDTYLGMDELNKKYPEFKTYGNFMDDRVILKDLDEFFSKKMSQFLLFVNSSFPHHPYYLPEESFRVEKGNDRFSRYLNSLHFSDYVLGEVIALLKEHGLDKNTIFIFHSDHGEAFYQHPGNFLHSIYLYEENVKSLSFIYNPMIFPKKIEYVDNTTHMDLVPTILNLLNISYEKDTFDGTSIFNRTKNQKAIFYTTFDDPLIGLRDGNYKFIWNSRFDLHELYDLSLDPYEKNNISDSNSKLVEQFSEVAKDLWKKLN